jgi:hypothetical protein
VALCNADATVPEKHGNSIERYASEKKLHGERIPESVSVAGRHLCEFKEPLKPSLPFSFSASSISHLKLLPLLASLRQRGRLHGELQNFSGDVKMREEPIEQVKAAKFNENDKRRESDTTVTL